MAGGAYGEYTDNCIDQWRGVAHDESGRNTANVFPNPADGQLQVIYALESESVEFLLHNSVGQLVDRAILQGNTGSHTVNSSNLPEGVYYYFIGKSLSGKVVIMH